MAFAASFDCGEASRDLDKAICSIPKLSKLDEDMSSYYFKLKETLDGEAAESLLKEQRTWLKQRNEACSTNLEECLVSLYGERILKLRKEHENLIPYTYSKANMFQGVKGACSFDSDNLPDDIIIYAGGAYSGKDIDFQIDQSGSQATQFEVIVNSPDKPVALILGAYDPSIWNIAWTQGTKISAVLATGNHRQAVAGLPVGTPILISTSHGGGPCGYLYVTKKNLREINPLSRKAFNKEVSLVHYANDGRLVFGNQINSTDKLYTSKDTAPDTFHDTSAILAGKAGLDDFVARGLMRKVTIDVAERWENLKADTYKEDLPPVASGGSSFKLFNRVGILDGYVILAQVTIPAGLYGAHSAVFFLEEGVPYPKGKLGHSTLYDFNTMSCSGSGSKCNHH